MSFIYREREQVIQREAALLECRSVGKRHRLRMRERRAQIDAGKRVRVTGNITVEWIPDPLPPVDENAFKTRFGDDALKPTICPTCAEQRQAWQNGAPIPYPIHCPHL